MDGQNTPENLGMKPSEWHHIEGAALMREGDEVEKPVILIDGMIKLAQAAIERIEEDGEPPKEIKEGE